MKLDWQAGGRRAQIPLALTPQAEFVPPCPRADKSNGRIATVTSAPQKKSLTLHIFYIRAKNGQVAHNVFIAT